MEVLKDIFVPMRDGVELAVDIYRPDEPGPHPAVLQRTPYLKAGVIAGMGLTADGLPATSPVGPITAGMLGNVQGLVDAGYAVVVGDARGTGNSEGVYDYYNFEGGPFDGYDTIEWLAAQPWCDGNVGMMGASASAIYCYIAALTHPPHLKVISSNMHPTDLYMDQWFVGGVFRYENRIGWSTGMIARLAPQDPGDPSSPNYDRKRAVYRRRYHHYFERMAAGKNPVNLDWLTEAYQHREYDGFWRQRSFAHRLAEIDVPTLHGGVLFDHFARGTWNGHMGIGGPKRLVMTPGALANTTEAADGGFPELQRRWFDRFLRGIENGVLAEPEVRFRLMGADRWVDEPVWPVPTVDQSLFFAPGPGGAAASSNDGLLRRSVPEESSADTIVHDPSAPNPTPRDLSDQRAFETGCLTYTSAPLEAGLEVIGFPHVQLFALSDAADVDWVVRLCDIFPDGRAQLLNVGALKATHFASHTHPESLTPGRIYEFDIEIPPVLNYFQPGHRVRLDLATSDFPFFEANALPSTNRVFMGASHASRLLLPVRTSIVR